MNLRDVIAQADPLVTPCRDQRAWLDGREVVLQCVLERVAIVREGDGQPSVVRIERLEVGDLTWEGIGRSSQQSRAIALRKARARRHAARLEQAG